MILSVLKTIASLLNLNFEFNLVTLKATELNFILPSTFGLEACPLIFNLPFK